MGDFIHWFVYPACLAGLLALCSAAIVRPKIFMLFAPWVLFVWLLVAVALTGYDAGVYASLSVANGVTPDALSRIRDLLIPAWILAGQFVAFGVVVTFGRIHDKLHVKGHGSAEYRQPPEPPVDPTKH